MTNKEIAKKFDLLAKLMELHDDNPFKIRSYRNAYNILRQTGTPLIELNYEDLIEIPGIGKAIASKIIELRNTGSFSALEKMLEKTPPGILDILKLKGLGPKKIKMIWQQLGVESLGELEYAIKENRLTLLKGFGKKTQDNILKQIEFLESVKGSFLFYKILPQAINLLDKLKYQIPGYSFELTGDLRRYFPTVTGIVILTDMPFDKIFKETPDYFDIKAGDIFFNEINVRFIRNVENSFGKDLLINTGPKLFVDNFKNFEGESEQEIFINNKLPYIPPVYRDNEVIINNPAEFNESKYVHQQDIKGVIHNHTVWSDGSNSVEELAMYCKEKGYDYLVVTDHSKSAYYANGLNLDRLEYYLEDIAKANQLIEDFQIFSGIESDILSDGSLDYDDEILEKFDVVIASIHSGLRMDIDKATNRIIKAIENPFTKILGHMTGRILLAREGYPLDYERIFDACKSNKVVIELNANPHRLDIDWSLIALAQSIGVKFSINPDAHAKEEVDFIEYGVYMAQKGGVLKENCLNVKNVEEFQDWVKNNAF